MTFEEYLDANAAQLSQSLTAFQQQELQKGFIDTTENGKLLIKALNDNGLKPTVENLVACAKAHTPELGYKFYYTADEQALNAVRAQYPADTLALFDRWYAYQHIEKNTRTEAAILSECKGHVVDKAFLDLALGRAASKGHVTFSRAPGQESYIAGQYSGKDLRDTVKPEEMTDALGNRLHRAPRDVQGEAGKQFLASLERKEKEQGRSTGHDETYWIERAEKACGANLASTKGELRRMVVTKPGTSVVDWEATAKAREAMQKNIGSR
jgi:hypothetical protein